MYAFRIPADALSDVSRAEIDYNPSSIADDLSELYLVFSATEGSTPQRVCYENLADPEHPRATTLGVPRREFTPEVVDFVTALGTRQFLLAEGHCVVSERYRDSVESYAEYLDAVGLLERGAAANVVYVKDPTETLAVLQLLAERCLEVVPYCQRSEFYDLASQAGASVYGSGPVVASEVVERFYSKFEYRNWVHEQFGADGIPFPRASLLPDPALRARSDRDLDRVFEYAEQYPTTGEQQTLLFVQAESTAGGTGNARVMRAADGSYTLKSGFGVERSFPDQNALREHLFENSSSGVIEVTPYVPVNRSYSFVMMIADEGVTILGPLDQVLAEESNDYRGWKLDTGAPASDYIDLDAQLRMAKAYALTLHEEGYRGWADEDLFQFVGPDGEEYVSRSESNIRRDAVSHLIAIILKDARLREQFVSGGLSIRQNDHLHVTSETLGGSPISAVAVANAIADTGVPLFGRNSQYGALLVSAPVEEAGSGLGTACVGILAPDDLTRDRWYDALEQRFTLRASSGMAGSEDVVTRDSHRTETNS